MECPKCRKNISDDEAECPFCGTKLKETASKKKHRIKASVKKKPVKKTDIGMPTEKNDTDYDGINPKVKFVIVGICLVLIVILLGIIISSVFSSSGIKYAETASEYIGRDVKSLEAEEDMHFSDESKSYGVNSAVRFDYIYESADTIKANGVTYPEWAVFADIGEYGFITDVIYTDFSVVKNDLRGHKEKSLINLDSFKKGDKQASVTKKIGLKPYSIHYSQSGIVLYTYKYYFKRDNGDEQAVILRAAFDENGKYQYYSSELIFPENM